MNKLRQAILVRLRPETIKSSLGSIFAVLVLAACLFTPNVSAAAANVSSLAVSPPTFDLTANPGDTLSESIKVENISSSNQTVNVSLENFVPLGTEGQVNITDQANQYSLLSWLNVTPSSAIIPANGSQVFNFTVNVPSNAEPGGKFSSIVFTTAPSKSTNNSSISVSQRIGTLVLLRISGQANEDLAVKSFLASDTHSSNTVTFNSLFQNLGNVQVEPTGYVQIRRNMFGGKPTSLNLTSRYILPGAERSFVVNWKHGFLFGKYNATLTVLYGQSNKLLSARTSFWVIPWKLILIVLAAIVVIGFLLYKARRRLFKALRILIGRE